MPRLPNANDLGTVTMRPATGVASADLSAPYRATQQIGNQLTQIGEGLADDENKLELGKAQSDFYQAQTDVHGMFQRDNDYSTMQQRYDQAMQNVTNSASSGISSGRLKSQFDNWARQQTTQGSSQIQALAWNKERDDNIAQLDTLQTNNLNAAMSAGDEATRTGIIDATNNAITGAQQKGYISAEQAVNLKQQWTMNYAKGSLAMMTPEQRISALQSGSGLVSFIPPDQRLEMVRSAASESLNTRLSNQQLQMYTGNSGMNVQIPDNALLDAVFQQESGNQHRNADGSLVTSPKGAQGVGQIMPTTGKDPGYGVKPLQDDSEQENRRFAGDYLGAMLKKYSGNQVLALAAYNAGPDQVDNWIKQIGDPRSGVVTNEQFASSIPANETRNYVYSVSANAQRMGNVQSVINSPEFKLLDGKQQAQIASRTLQVQDQADSAYRLNIQQRMTDDATKAEAGVNIDAPVTEAEFIRSIPASATPAEREQSYQNWNRYKDTLSLQPVNQFVTQNSAQEGLSAVQALKPTAGAADYQFKSQQYAQAVQNYNRVIKARESDPGAWLAQNSPEVKTAFQNYQQDPSQGAALAQAVMVEKSRLGIKSKDILPDAMTDSILQQIDTSKEQAVTAIQSVASQFGPYAGQVMQQVQKKAAPVLQVIMSTDSPRAANALWQNRGVKTSDLRGSFQKTDADSADSSWADQFKGAAATLVLQGEGVKTWNNFDEQGKRLTYINMQRGMDSSSAAKQAYQDLFGSQYELNGTWRLPVKTGLDVRDVSDGAGHYLENLKPSDIMPLIGDPRLGDDVNRAQSLTRIKDSGEWVTNSDETGLTLMANGLVVNGANGQPVTVNFSDLAKLGASNRGVTNQFIKDINKPKIVTPGESARESQQRSERTASELGNLGNVPDVNMSEGMRGMYDDLHR